MLVRCQNWADQLDSNMTGTDGQCFVSAEFGIKGPDMSNLSLI